jgi:4-hydroxybenzoate polyprenyltransferase
MWPILLEVVKGVALIIIALLCMLTGLVAATKAFPSWDLLWDKTTTIFILFYLLPNVIFLAYRQMFSSPKYRNHEPPTVEKQPVRSATQLVDERSVEGAAAWLSTWTGVTVCVMLLILTTSPPLYWSDLPVVFIFSSPLFYYCHKSYELFRSAQQPGSTEDARQQSFENLIFIPAFLLCIVNFSLGLLLERRIGQSHENAFAYLSWDDAPYLIGSYVVIDLYYRWRARAAYIYAACPLGVIVLGLLAFYAFNLESAKFIALAVMITFFIGFGEVTKHLYFIDNKNPKYVGDPRGIDFFMQGANWSGIVYPTLFLLAPAVFVEMSFLPIIFIVYIFVLFWLALDSDQKKSPLALVVSFAVGYGTPIAFMVSIAYRTRFFDPPLTDQTAFQTLLALIALIGFMAGLLRLSKDLFGLNLAAFVRNIWYRELYSNDAACLFLLLSTSLMVCIILTCAWLVLFIFPAVSEVKLYATRLALVGVAVVVLSVLAVVMFVFRPSKLALIIQAAEEINNMPFYKAGVTPNSALASVSFMRTAMLVLRSGRFGVSSIPGFAVALIINKSPFYDWLDVLAGFVCITLATMSGFIMNDIYDQQKDSLAGKLRPLTTGELSAIAGWRSVIIFVTASLLLSYASFGYRSTLWIAAICGALFIYSPAARRFPIVKGPYTALLAISPFLFAGSSTGIDLPLGALGSLASYILFREAVLDAADVKGDATAGMRTVGVILGAKTASIVGWTGMFVTLVASLYVFSEFSSKVAIVFGISFQLIAVAMFACRLPYSLGVTRLTMFAGVIAVSLGV